MDAIIHEVIKAFSHPGLAVLPFFGALLVVPFLFLFAGRMADELLFGDPKLLREKGPVARALLQPFRGLLPFWGFAVGIYIDAEIFNNRGTHIPAAFDLAVTARFLTVICILRFLYALLRFFLNIPNLTREREKRLLVKLSFTRNPAARWTYIVLAVLFLAMLGILGYVLLMVIALGLLMAPFALREPARDLAAGMYQMLVLKLQPGTRLENGSLHGRLLEIGLFHSILEEDGRRRKHANGSLFLGPLIVETKPVSIASTDAATRGPTLREHPRRRQGSEHQY